MLNTGVVSNIDLTPPGSPTPSSSRHHRAREGGHHRAQRGIQLAPVTANKQCAPQHPVVVRDCCTAVANLALALSTPPTSPLRAGMSATLTGAHNPTPFARKASGTLPEVSNVLRRHLVARLAYGHHPASADQRFFPTKNGAILRSRLQRRPSPAVSAQPVNSAHWFHVAGTSHPTRNSDGFANADTFSISRSPSSYRLRDDTQKGAARHDTQGHFDANNDDLSVVGQPGQEVHGTGNITHVGTRSPSPNAHPDTNTYTSTNTNTNTNAYTSTTTSIHTNTDTSLVGIRLSDGTACSEDRYAALHPNEYPGPPRLKWRSATARLLASNNMLVGSPLRPTSASMLPPPSNDREVITVPHAPLAITKDAAHPKSASPKATQSHTTDTALTHDFKRCYVAFSSLPITTAPSVYGDRNAHKGQHLVTLQARQHQQHQDEQVHDRQQQYQPHQQQYQPHQQHYRRAKMHSPQHHEAQKNQTSEVKERECDEGQPCSDKPEPPCIKTSSAPLVHNTYFATSVCASDSTTVSTSDSAAAVRACDSADAHASDSAAVDASDSAAADVPDSAALCTYKRVLDKACRRRFKPSTRPRSPEGTPETAFLPHVEETVDIARSWKPLRCRVVSYAVRTCAPDRTARHAKSGTDPLSVRARAGNLTHIDSRRSIRGTSEHDTSSTSRDMHSAGVLSCPSSLLRPWPAKHCSTVTARQNFLRNSTTTPEKNEKRRDKHLGATDTLSTTSHNLEHAPTTFKASPTKRSPDERKATGDRNSSRRVSAQSQKRARSVSECGQSANHGTSGLRGSGYTHTICLSPHAQCSREFHTQAVTKTRLARRASSTGPSTLTRLVRGIGCNVDALLQASPCLEQNLRGTCGNTSPASSHITVEHQHSAGKCHEATVPLQEATMGRHSECTQNVRESEAFVPERSPENTAHTEQEEHRMTAVLDSAEFELLAEVTQGAEELLQRVATAFDTVQKLRSSSPTKQQCAMEPENIRVAHDVQRVQDMADELGHTRTERDNLRVKNEELEARIDTLKRRMQESESDRQTWLLELEQMQRLTVTQDSLASMELDDVSCDRESESPAYLDFGAGNKPRDIDEHCDAARMLCRSDATRSTFSMEESPEETKPEKTY